MPTRSRVWRCVCVPRHGRSAKTRDAPRFLPSSRSPDVCARSPIHLPCFEEPCHVREELPPPPGINPKGINTHTVRSTEPSSTAELKRIVGLVGWVLTTAGMALSCVPCSLLACSKNDTTAERERTIEDLGASGRAHLVCACHGERIADPRTSIPFTRIKCTSGLRRRIHTQFSTSSVRDNTSQYCKLTYTRSSSNLMCARTK